MSWTAAAIREDVQAAGYASAEDALAAFFSESISQVGSLWASFLASKKDAQAKEQQLGKEEEIRKTFVRIELAFSQSFAKTVLQEWLAESRGGSAQRSSAKRLSPKELQQKWREEERSRQEIESKRKSGGKQDLQQPAQEDEVQVQHAAQPVDPECQAKMLKLLIKGSTDEQVKLRGSCVDMSAAMCFLRVRFGS